ncbi:MAG: PAS domain S-box protein [Desulfobacterales bacterium]|nr:PAS domain S-box protein [Desulfobacterales bacterium]
MDLTTFIGLVNNAALLLALGLLYDMLPLRSKAGATIFQRILTGLIIGAIGIAIMLNPWDFGQGILFDTRSVLLCIVGFFFGTVPALVAMGMTGAFRLLMGGVGAWTGVGVIVTSGAIGLGWRHFRRHNKKDPTTGALYLCGIVVHVAMLAWMLSLPDTIAVEVLPAISLPVMLIYPLATAVLGTLMVNRRAGKRAEAALRESENRFRQIYEHLANGIAQVSLDFKIERANRAFCRMLGYREAELVGKQLIEITKPETWQENLANQERLKKGEIDHYRMEKSFNHKDGHTVWGILDANIIRDGAGNPAYFLGSVVDITDRKRTEEEQASNYTLLRIAGETARFGGWNVDLRSDTCTWSDTVADIHEMPRGYSPLVKDGIGFYAPEWRGKITRVFTDCAEKGIPYDEEMEIITKTGKCVWVRTVGEAVRDENGKIVKVQGSFQDITESKRAEKALRESERLHKEAQKVAQIGHWELEPKIGTPKWSEQVFHIFGLDPEMGEPSFSDHQTLVHPEDWHILNDAVSLAAKEGTPFDIHFRIQRSDGEEKWLHAMGTATKGNDGKVQKIFGTAQDITERLRAEEELRRRESQLQQIFEILPIGLWFADKDGRLLRGNPAGIKIWGAEPHVPISEYGVFKARRLPSDEPVKADDWALAKTVRNGATIVDELLEIETFDGKKKTILNYTAPVLDKEGHVEGAIVVNLDISERTALEAQLRQAQKLESVGRLAGGVAHDYNNMLSVILGYTEMALEKVEPTDPLHEDLTEILAAARHSANITRQLLAFARQQTISPDVLDLNESIEDMLKMLRRLIGEDIDLLWKPGKSVWPVKMDPVQLDQILANLCVNARDAISGLGKVTIETAAAVFDAAYCAEHAGFVPGEYVMLAVSDDGCGMDKKTLDSLFDPFFTTKAVGEGTGLGLATVYGIAKQNDGFVSVYSDLGKGSTFRIYLPRHTAPTEKKKVPVAPEALQGEGETILLVEDEPSILRIGIKMLESLNYAVLAAPGPDKAAALAQGHKGEIHLLITDVVMPEMNGRDLAERLQSLYPDLRVLFMSGYPTDVIAERGVLGKGVFFMQKPFTRQELAAKVIEALEG